MQGVSITSPISDSQAAALLARFPNIEQASQTDSYSATAQTVRYMIRLVRHSVSDPVIKAALVEAVRRFGAALGTDEVGIASCIWWYAKFSVRFIHHQKLFQQWLGKSDELQLLISPEVVLKMQRPKGDCAVFTCLICAMLEAAGMNWDIVTAAVDPRQPDVFSHVYPRAILTDGERLVMDASHGKHPGWEVDSRRISRRQVFNAAGNPVNDPSFFFAMNNKELVWD